MPSRNIESLDDPLVFDGTTAVAGMVSAVKSNRLAREDMVTLAETELDVFGMLRTRGPVLNTRLEPLGAVQGLFYYDSPGLERLWCASNGKLHYVENLEVNSWVISPWVKNFANVGNAGVTVVMAQLVDTLYVLDASLGGQRWAPGETGFTAVPAMPRGALLAAHGFRLFVAGVSGKDDFLYASDILDGNTWPDPGSVVRIGDGEGDPITGMVSWRQSLLVVAKRETVWTVNTAETSPANWTIERVPGDYGCVAPRTLTRVGNDVWFLSELGILSIRRMAGQQDQEVTLPLSAPVQNYFQRMNKAAMAAATAVYNENRFVVSFPIDGSLKNNCTLVYNTQTQRWQSVVIGNERVNPSVWVRTRFNGPELVMGNGQGYVLWWRASAVTAYADDEIYPDWLTRAPNNRAGERVKESDSDVVWQIIHVAPNPAPPAPGDPEPIWPASPVVGQFFSTARGAAFLLFQCVSVNALIPTVWVSKAYMFEEPINAKLGSHIEVEFFDSVGQAAIEVSLDGRAWQTVTEASWNGVTASSGGALGQNLPFNLAGSGSLRKAFDLQEFGEFREIQVRVRALNDFVQVREVYLAAYMNTLRLES